MSEALNKATKQANVKVSPISGVAPPVNRQFGQPNGNRRHNGAWTKEDTPRYKLEQMMKMSQEDLAEIIEDPTRPCFEQKLATAIDNGDWKVIESMINQVYGQPKIVQENHNVNYKPLVDLTKRKKNGEE